MVVAAAATPEVVVVAAVDHLLVMVVVEGAHPIVEEGEAGMYEHVGVVVCFNDRKVLFVVVFVKIMLTGIFTGVKCTAYAYTPCCQHNFHFPSLSSHTSVYITSDCSQAMSACASLLCAICSASRFPTFLL